MPSYLSPGVYVEEIPSAVQAIAGVSTSTAGFIGKATFEKVIIPPGPIYRVEDEIAGMGHTLAAYPVVTKVGTYTVYKQPVGGSKTEDKEATLENDFANQSSKVVFTTEPANTDKIVVSYDTFAKVVSGELVGTLAVTQVERETAKPDANDKKLFYLAHFPVIAASGEFHVFVKPAGEGAEPVAKEATVQNDPTATPPVAKVVFTENQPTDAIVTVTYKYYQPVKTLEKQSTTPDNTDKKVFLLSEFPAITRLGEFQVFVTLPGGTATVAKNATLQNDLKATPPVSKVVFTTAPPKDAAVTVTYKVGQELRLAAYPVSPAAVKVKVGEYQVAAEECHVVNDFRERATFLQVTNLQGAPTSSTVMVDYVVMPPGLVVHKAKLGVGAASTKKFPLTSYPVTTTTGMFAVRVGDYLTVDPVQANDVNIKNDDITKSAWVAFNNAPDVNLEIWVDYLVQPIFTPLLNEVKLCTSFSEYRKHFGDFSADPDLNTLTHAVYGFFHNGGSRCYVGIMKKDTDIDSILEKFAAIDEIAIVAAPGITDKAIRDKIVTHCKVQTQDRFAIFDSPEKLADDDLTLLSSTNPNRVLPSNSDYAAFYFPWIQVFDPAEKTMRPKGDGRVYMPPDGHIAGIYARVDNTRGVHKAPANEIVLGALGLKYQISKAQQDGLNPQGVNCIRELNGNIRVWGARTIGGDANGEWRYINVRRTMLYLRESIDEGTQWAVFEPNDQALWAKITRNVSAFLTNVWRTGALFGSTPAEAFYVKCDAETNPPDLREIGQVVTEIGVAIVRPAEFVIFRISQWQPQKS